MPSRSWHVCVEKQKLPKSSPSWRGARGQSASPLGKGGFHAAPPVPEGPYLSSAQGHHEEDLTLVCQGAAVRRDAEDPLVGARGPQAGRLENAVGRSRQEIRRPASPSFLQPRPGGRPRGLPGGGGAHLESNLPAGVSRGVAAFVGIPRPAGVTGFTLLGLLKYSSSARRQVSGPFGTSSRLL